MGELYAYLDLFSAGVDAMRGHGRQHCEAHRFAARKPWQPRCGTCGKILDRRTVKPKGTPRLCATCQTQVEILSYQGQNP